VSILTTRISGYGLARRRGCWPAERGQSGPVSQHSQCGCAWSLSRTGSVRPAASPRRAVAAHADPLIPLCHYLGLGTPWGVRLGACWRMGISGGPAFCSDTRRHGTTQKSSISDAPAVCLRSGSWLARPGHGGLGRGQVIWNLANLMPNFDIEVRNFDILISRYRSHKTSISRF
jgi:hypothetical protein